MSARSNRIVIIDDDPIFRTLAGAKIADDSTEILTADDGASALAMAKCEKLDLAVIDLGLPDIDGFDLIAQLRDMPQTRHLPLIVVTGREDSGAIDKAFELGATSFLTKPINWKLFAYQIAYVLRSARIEQVARRAHVRAQAESRIKDQLTSRINHSIQPRVRHLMSAAERLVTLTSRLSQANEVSDEANTLIQGANRLREDLSGMMFLTRAVSGALILTEERHRIGAIVGNVIQNVTPTATRQGVRLNVDLPRDDVFVEADWTKLTWSLSNLMENALRHSPAGSCTTLSVEHLRDGSLYICVDDEGPGIPPDLLAHLLSPIVDEAANINSGRLSGLGLIVAKLIAEGHGGSLTVRSSPGMGTTAGILLPPDRVYAARPSRVA
jgi:signal transduction histidine kinase